MKNQYFGDNRDLFKYDLIYRIINDSLVKHFTFIPMLTKDDGTEQGGERDRSKAKAGRRNCELVRFLNQFGDKDKRDIKQLKGFFGKLVKIDKGDEYFSHEQREEYFKRIENDLPSKSLIFVDPDIGLQVKRTRDKHIKYSEVKSIYKHMDNSSILMIFQFIPREVREAYFSRISGKLKEEAEDSPIYISDNQIAFFFLAKNKSLKESLCKVITKYKRIYQDKGVFSQC